MGQILFLCMKPKLVYNGYFLSLAGTVHFCCFFILGMLPMMQLHAQSPSPPESWKAIKGTSPIYFSGIDNAPSQVYYLEAGRIVKQDIIVNSKAKPKSTKLGKAPFTPTVSLPIPSDGIVIAGKEKETIRVAMLKDQKMVWAIALPDSIRGDIHAICQAPDGGYWLGGESRQGYLVVSIGDKGQLRWIKTQDKARDAFPAGIHFISPAGKGELLAVGYADPFRFGEKNGLIMRLKADNGAQAAFIDFGRERKDDIALAATLLPQGGYQVLVTEGQALVQYRLDANGQVMYDTHVLEDSLAQLKAIALPDTAGFRLWGKSPNSPNWVFYKLPLAAKNSKKKAVATPLIRAVVMGYTAGESQFSIQDAEALSQLLQHAETAGLAKVKSIELIGNQADKIGLLNALSDMEMDYKRGLLDSHSLILISLTLPGHRAEKGDFYFCPKGWDATHPAATGISIADIEQYLQRIPNPKLLLLDASFSGAATISLKNTLAITSCGAQEHSHESPDWQSGAFMQALKEALDGKADANGDRQLILGELGAYLLQQVPLLAKSKGFVQYPGLLAKANDDLVLLLLDGTGTTNGKGGN